MPSPRVTLKDLAAKLGVSHTTVSLALRDHPSISAATKERVKEIARKLKYRPDPMLRSLAAYRQQIKPKSFQGVLGWLTNYPTRDGWEVGQQIGYHAGAVKRAEELGYELTSFWIREPQVSPTRLRKIMQARNVQGLILAAQPQPQTSISFNWKEFAAVSLGYSLSNPSLHLVMNHQFRNMVTLVKKLIDQGYRRIGLAMPASRDDRVEHNYLAGYLIGVSASVEVSTLPPHFPAELETDSFRDWVFHNQPEVVVTESSSAETLWSWIKSSNERDQSQMGLAVANTPYGRSEFTGINEDPEIVGATAVEVVVGMLYRNEFGVPGRARHILIQGTWQKGQTAFNPKQKTRKRSG